MPHKIKAATSASAAEASPFFERLARRCEARESNLCIGLDPDARRLPRHLGKGVEAVYKFCIEIIEATADSAAAYKPNSAFFEALGVEGWSVLEQVVAAVPDGIPVILDSKRGDIGSTAQMYARAAFDRLKADALTVNPLLGFDAVEPFLEYEQRGVYVMCLTPNPGASDFMLPAELYLNIARKARLWNTRNNCGLVVGASKPQFITSILAIAPDLPLLIPGLGGQGADLEAIMGAAPALPRHQLLFNVSRSIIYAADDSTFGRQARVAARYYCNRINTAREKTLATSRAPE